MNSSHETGIDMTGDPTQRSESRESDKYTMTPWMHALFIGFLIGIVIFSVAVNSVGFLTLIPLYLIYKFTRAPKEDT